MKKIALVGAGGVGKTTLFTSLETLYVDNPEIGFVSEVAREFYAENPVPAAERLTYEVQSRLLDMIISKEKAAAKKVGIQVLLCDRAAICSPAHVSAGGDYDGSDRLVEKIRLWLPTYSKIFLLDPDGVPYKRDEVRTETPEQRIRTHNAYVNVFVEHGIDYELLSGGPEQRLSNVQEMI